MSIARNVVINAVGAVVTILVALISVPSYLRLVGTEKYGALAVLWALLSYFAFFDFGLGRATAQRIASLGPGRAQDGTLVLNTALRLTLVLGLIGGLFLWAGARFFLPSMLPDAEARRELLAALPLLIFALPVVLLNGVMTGALQARERFAYINVIAVASVSLNQLVPLVVVLVGATRLGALVPAALVGNAVALGLNLSACRRAGYSIGIGRWERREVAGLLTYGGGMTLLSLVGPLLVTADRMVIGGVAGTAAVAIYAVPYGVVSRLMIVTGSLSSALFPRLAGTTRNESAEIANRATESLMAIITPATIAGVFLSAPLLAAWVGPDVATQSAFVAEILLVGIWANAMVAPHFTRLLAEARLRPIVLAYVVQLPLYFGMLVFGLERWGVMGAAIAWTARVALDTVLLLAIAGALGRTIRQNLGSTLLVLASLAARSLADGNLRWVLGFVFLGLSIALGWTRIHPVIQALLRRLRVPSSHRLRR